jgi:hypothetical protein
MIIDWPAYHRVARTCVQCGGQFQPSVALQVTCFVSNSANCGRSSPLVTDNWENRRSGRMLSIPGKQFGDGDHQLSIRSSMRFSRSLALAAR